jgi:hypothetical protein
MAQAVRVFPTGPAAHFDYSDLVMARADCQLAAILLLGKFSSLALARVHLERQSTLRNSDISLAHSSNYLPTI